MIEKRALLQVFVGTLSCCLTISLSNQAKNELIVVVAHLLDFKSSIP